MDEDKELNVEELNYILGGAPRKIAEEVALENPSLHRQKHIDRLKKEKKALLASKEYENNNSGRGR